tara:strand:- start:810 stop:1394 length:585 start_codon:yes stop_codon:yes gene_type:complete
MPLKAKKKSRKFRKKIKRKITAKGKRISELPKKIIQYVQNSPCPICLEALGKNWIKTPCRHFFHKHCLETWCSRSIECACPICREKIPYDFFDEEEPLPLVGDYDITDIEETPSFVDVFGDIPIPIQRQRQNTPIITDDTTENMINDLANLNLATIPNNAPRPSRRDSDNSEGTGISKKTRRKKRKKRRKNKKN